MRAVMLWQRLCPSATGHNLSGSDNKANINCKETHFTSAQSDGTAAASPPTGLIRAHVLCRPAVRKTLGCLVLFLAITSGIWYVTLVLPKLSYDQSESSNEPANHSSVMETPTGPDVETMMMTQILEDFKLKNEISLSEVVNDLKTNIKHFNDKVTNVELQNRQFLVSFSQQIKQLREESRCSSSLLQQRLAALEQHTDRMSQELCSLQEKMNTPPPITEGPASLTHLNLALEDVSEQDLDGALLADQMANYALESQGASVVSHRSSETFQTTPPFWTFFGFPIWLPNQSQWKVIQGGSRLLPGDCWAFAGGQGHLVISLSHPITISHVTIDHIPPNISPTGHIDSAPKSLQVFGMGAEDETKGTWLGSFTYDKDGDTSQTFELPDPDKGVFTFVRLQVLSNWGHPEYTCLYRFRVHGQILSL